MRRTALEKSKEVGDCENCIEGEALRKTGNEVKSKKFQAHEREWVKVATGRTVGDGVVWSADIQDTGECKNANADASEERRSERQLKSRCGEDRDGLAHHGKRDKGMTIKYAGHKDGLCHREHSCEGVSGPVKQCLIWSFPIK